MVPPIAKKYSQGRCKPTQSLFNSGALGGVRIGTAPRVASPEAGGVERSPQRVSHKQLWQQRSNSLRRRSQDSKASARKADHRECNSLRRLQGLLAGVARYEERVLVSP
jgi:hypothetical protein